ncbi:hypothetical protein Bca4012_078947 [Brassica carinata]
MYFDNINNQVKILIIYKYTIIPSVKLLWAINKSPKSYLEINLIINGIKQKTDRQNRERESSITWKVVDKTKQQLSLPPYTTTHTHTHSPLNLLHLLCSISEESYSSN